MAFKLGSTDINQIYLGSTDIKKVHLGSALIHDTTSGPPPSGITFVNSAIAAAVDTSHPATNPLTLSYTPAAVGNVVLLLPLFESGGTSFDASIDSGGAQIPTWAGNSMQVSGVVNNSRRHSGLYGLQAGTTSAASFSFSPTNGMRGAQLVVAEFSGVDTTTIFNAAGSTFSTGDSINPTLTTVDAAGVLVGGATFASRATAATVTTGTLIQEGETGTDATKDIRYIAAWADVVAALATEGVAFNQTGNSSACAVVGELNPA